VSVFLKTIFFSSNSRHAALLACCQTVLKPSSSPNGADSQSEGFVLPVRRGRTTIFHDVYVIQSVTPDYFYFCRKARIRTSMLLPTGWAACEQIGESPDLIEKSGAQGLKRLRPRLIGCYIT